MYSTLTNENACPPVGHVVSGVGSGSGCWTGGGSAGAGCGGIVVIVVGVGVVVGLKSGGGLPLTPDCDEDGFGLGLLELSAVTGSEACPVACTSANFMPTRKTVPSSSRPPMPIRA